MRSSLDYAVAWMITRVGITSDRGATLVEYVLLVSLIVVATVAAVKLLGNGASSKFSSVGTRIQ